jgi:(2Fe-2S) ferredoxin
MKKPPVEFRIGLGSCGVASGGEPVRAALEQAAGNRATVKTVGCNGMCHCEPMVEVVEPGGRTTLYGNVDADTAQRIVRKHLRPAWLPEWVRADGGALSAMKIERKSATGGSRADEGVRPTGHGQALPNGRGSDQSRARKQAFSDTSP